MAVRTQFFPIRNGTFGVPPKISKDGAPEGPFWVIRHLHVRNRTRNPSKSNLPASRAASLQAFSCKRNYETHFVRDLAIFNCLQYVSIISGMALGWAPQKNMCLFIYICVFLLPLFSSVAGVKHLMHLHGVPVSGLGSCFGVGCYTKDLFLALGGNSPLQDHKNAVPAQNGAAILKIKTFPWGFQGFPASQKICRGTCWGASSKNHKNRKPNSRA